MPQLILLLLIVIGGGYFVGNYFYNLAIRAHEEKYQEEHLLELEKDRSWIDGVPSEDLYIQSFDGAFLHGTAVTADTEKWVIIQHKYQSWGRNMSHIGQGFHALGFSVLLVDARGHGESQGEYIGMGWHDRLDIREWIQYLNDHFSCRSILLFGFSMGASTMVFVGGEELPTNVKGIVSDSGYSSIKDVLRHQLNRRYHLPSFPFLRLASIVTKRRAGYSLIGDGDGVKQMHHCKIPILFIHCTGDTDVPISMMEKLYDAGNAPREKLVVEGSSHCMAAWDARDEYWLKIKEFCDKYINIE